MASPWTYKQLAEYARSIMLEGEKAAQGGFFSEAYIREKMGSIESQLDWIRRQDREETMESRRMSA